MRITFRDREAAYKAVEGASRGELNVGGRTVVITFWENEGGAETGLPFMMDIDPAPSGGAVRRQSRSGSFSSGSFPAPGSFSALAARRPGSISIFDESAPANTNANGEQLSEHMPGFRVVVPKQVEFSKKEGWFSGWTNSLVGAGAAKSTSNPASAPQHHYDEGVGSTIGRGYRYFMDEVVGFKYL